MQPIGQIDRFDDAAQQFEQALACGYPIDPACDRLAAALQETGRLDDALAILHRALVPDSASQTPACIRAWLATRPEIPAEREPILLHLIRTLFWAVDADDWADIVDAALALPTVLGPRSRYIILIDKAISHWVTGDICVLERTLEDCEFADTLRRGTIETEDWSRRFLAMRAYTDFLGRLAAIRRSAPRPTYEATPFPIIGDSHCLTYAGAPAYLDDHVLRVRSILVAGCRGWDLARGHNVMAESFARKLATLPRESSAGVSFGEIDCRPQHGILSQWRRVGGALTTLVREQVTGAVCAVARQAERSDLALWFLTVAAPREEFIPASDRTAIAEIVARYNEALHSVARAEGHRIIDIYAADQNGFARRGTHIDFYHLNPGPLSLD